MPRKKKQNKIQLEQAAGDHLTISKLLRLERAPEQKKAVEKILTSRNSLSEKIRLIKAVDIAASRRKEGETAVQRTCYDPEALHNRKKIKNLIRDNTFLRYLFSHYSRIMKFGRETHILTGGMLPFSLKINRGIQKFFIEYLQKRYLVKLMKILNYVEETGWLHLTKREYNLVMVFRSLCSFLYRTDFNLLNYGNRYLIDILQSLETNFLILYSKKEYIDLLILSVKKVLQTENEFIEDDLAVLIKRILLKDLTLPSVYNFILGLNMIKSRRFLGLPDLLNRECGHVLSSRDYDCPDHIYQKIDQFISETETSMLPVLKRRKTIHKIKSFLPRELDEQKKFDLLESFYNDKKHQPPLVFSLDKANVINFTINLTGRFLAVCTDILNGYIKIEGTGPTEIFSNRFFSGELNKITFYRDKLEKLGYAFANFPMKRFKELQVSAGNALSMEIEIVQTIDKIISQFVEVGKKLADVILGRQKTGSPASEIDIRLDLEILSGRPYYIPYESGRITGHDILHSRTVLDALSLICCLCMVCGLFFRNTGIYELLRNEDRIEKNLKHQQELLQRIADPDRFREIKRKYKL